MLAINLLPTSKDESRFVLRMAKRNRRTGAIDLDDNRTSLVHLKHGEDSILWEQTAAPFAPSKPKKPKKTKEELSKARKKASRKEINDLDGLVAKITKPMKKIEIYELAKKDGHGSPYLVKKQWGEIESRLVKSNGRRFQQPTK